MLRRPRRPARRLGLIPHLLRRAVLLPPTRSTPSPIPTLNLPTRQRVRVWRRCGRTLVFLLGSSGAVKERARVKVLHDSDGRELFLIRIFMLVLLRCCVRARVTFRIDAGPPLPVRAQFDGCVFRNDCKLALDGWIEV